MSFLKFFALSISTPWYAEGYFIDFQHVIFSHCQAFIACRLTCLRKSYERDKTLVDNSIK